MSSEVRRYARLEVAPGVYVHRTLDPKRGLCDDCGADMRSEPHKPCTYKQSNAER